ncbi:MULTISPECIES: hypothetical protein [Staphylococcus]|uniref:hypothetical protein n=1 Tax=Staphylococcus TaxID=1279 RepID=UPI0007CA00FB|nr:MULTISPECIES: hypothetical protein [Staphylococcus]MDW4108235.1 hypothetical protein [Staphylococcus saprophyticus]MBF2179335.1 hypothetical protein [Staphylococcus warneri]MBF2186239.1 hypothetical protein [Staphylococcus warneri]MDU9840832.1 hypothetical protein [Staphylococcus aureus]MDV0014255.1 hypothetical protein [Staphylococcus aureus]
MNQTIVKLKENYVKDTEQIRHNISTTQERINKEKNKLANHQRKFDKEQLEYTNDVSMKLLDMVSTGAIDVKDLPTIKSYLFDDSGSLDVSSEVDVSSSNKDETVQSTSSHSDVDHNPFADANRHS